MSGPFALSNESSLPEPSATTMATPLKATARPAMRRRLTRSSPSAKASSMVIPGASATTSAAMPDVVYRVPTLRNMW